MNIRKILPILLSFILTASCNSKQKKIDSIERQLNETGEMIQAGQLNAAKHLLNSIDSLSPDLAGIRRKSNFYRNKIENIETHRELLYLDSMILTKQKLLDSVGQNFVLEKRYQIQYAGNYTHKLQLPEIKAQKTYLKASVSENGELFLTNTYFNKTPLGYISLVVKANDLFKESIQGNGANSVSQVFDDGFYMREVVTFNSIAENGICEFIATYGKHPTTVTLIGKSTYRYRLDAQDIKAISETWQFHLLIKELVNLKKNKTRAEYIIRQTEQG